MFPAIMENANRVKKIFQYSMKDRMTYFGIYLAVKCRRDSQSKILHDDQYKFNICDVLRDFLPFVKFKKT